MDPSFALAMNHQGKVPVIGLSFPKSNFEDEQSKLMAIFAEAVDLARMADKCELLLYFSEWSPHNPEQIIKLVEDRLTPLAELLKVKITGIEVASSKTDVVVVIQEDSS